MNLKIGLFLCYGGDILVDMDLVLKEKAEWNYYHDKSYGGSFSILYRDKNKYRQRSYKSSELDLVKEYVGKEDVFISQGIFYRYSRKQEHLKQIGLNFVDLDCYKNPYFKKMAKEELLKVILLFCRHQNILTPSVVVYSGNGFQLKWFYEKPLIAQALPRWQAVQKYLIKKFESLNSDPVARDCSRVFRLEGSINSKTGNKVEVLYNSELRYDFEFICEEFLPVLRSELEAKKKKKEALKKTKEKRNFFRTSLSEARYEDLVRLAELRGGVKEGERMTHLFWRMNFLALSGKVTLENFEKKASKIVEEMTPGWFEYERREQIKELSTLFGKLRSFLGQGKFIKGEIPLYTPKNRTLIEIFNIREEEMPYLKTIISIQEKKRRRRAKSKMAREAYILRSKERKERIYELTQEGLSSKTISKELGLSRGYVSVIRSSFGVKKQIKKVEDRIAEILLYIERGYNQSQIAKIMKVSRQYVNKLLKKCQPDISIGLY